MSRILHVEDNKAWRELVRDRLRDHHVDSAASLQDAVALLAAEPSYDVALVDLNLATDSDGQGGDILDLILARYPSTRRIVVTGSPPPGSVRTNVFERYDVEEILIKRDFEIRDLRRVVEAAIAQGPEGLPQSLRLRRSELKQRFREWEKVRIDRLEAQTRNAEEHLDDARRVSAQTRERARKAVEDAQKHEAEFRRECTLLRNMIDNARTGSELDAALAVLEAAQDRFGDGTQAGSGTPQ